MPKISSLDKMRLKYKCNPDPVYHSEADVQASVIKHYQHNGWIVNKIIQSTNNGWPDLECHKDGVTIFIECKATGKKPTPLQVYQHERLRAKKFTVLVIDKIIPIHAKHI